MPKESVVEIPSGSGNKYRYEYSDGATVYRGPVGSAPELGEEEFNMLTVEMPFGIGVGLESSQEEAFDVINNVYPQGDEIPSSEWYKEMEKAEQMVKLANDLRLYHGIRVDTEWLKNWMKWSTGIGSYSLHTAFRNNVIDKLEPEQKAKARELYKENRWFSPLGKPRD